MKPRTWMWAAVVYLFAALAMPVWTAAQDNPSQDKPKHHQYKLIDVGAFGGPESYINHSDSLGANNQMNNPGTTVGAAATTIPSPGNSNFSICGGVEGALPLVFHAFATRHDIVTDLGTLPGPDNCSVATSINASGEIAGYGENGLTDPLIGIREIRAMVWNGTIQDLGTFGGNHSGLGNINNRGQVAGWAMNAIPDPFSLYYLLLGSSNGTQTRAFLWQNGIKRDLGTLGGPDAFAGYVNEHGQVTGFSYTNSTPNPTTGVPTIDPYLWDRGVMIDLGTLGGTLGYAGPMNNHGQIIGTSNLAGDLVSHPFSWYRGVMTDIGTFGGSNGSALALNEAGEVVGVADFPGDQLHDAFLWKSGVLTDLGNLGKTSFGRAINSQGQVVGASRMADGVTIHAFLWEKGGPMVDLNDLVSPKSDAVLFEGVVINDSGRIGVNGLPPGCDNLGLCGHAYVLIPSGDCNDDCEQRVANSQANSALMRQSAPAITERAEPPLSPLERFRNMMRQRYHMPGQPQAPRD